MSRIDAPKQGAVHMGGLDRTKYTPVTQAHTSAHSAPTTVKASVKRDKDGDRIRRTALNIGRNIVPNGTIDEMIAEGMKRVYTTQRVIHSEKIDESHKRVPYTYTVTDMYFAPYDAAKAAPTDETPWYDKELPAYTKPIPAAMAQGTSRILTSTEREHVRPLPAKHPRSLLTEAQERMAALEAREAARKGA